MIISTGATARMLGLAAEQRLLGHGVSTCATCDGFFFREKPIAVVGGGDSALEEANFLTRFADKVTLVHRRKELRGVEDHAGPRASRTRRSSSCGTAWSTTSSATARSRRCGCATSRPAHESELAVDRRCSSPSATTRTPTLFRGQLDLDETATSSPRADSTRTSVDGVFAAGDVQDHVYRQAITAAGSGCMAALEAERWLGEHATRADARDADRVAAECARPRSVAPQPVGRLDRPQERTHRGRRHPDPHRRDVRRDRRRRRHARPRRLLGRVVRAVQDDRADARQRSPTSTRASSPIAKLNVDDNPDIARRFEVMSIPTLLVFEDGEPVKRLVGAKGKGQLLEELAEFIA